MRKSLKIVNRTARFRLSRYAIAALLLGAVALPGPGFAVKSCKPYDPTICAAQPGTHLGCEGCVRCQKGTIPDKSYRNCVPCPAGKTPNPSQSACMIPVTCRSDEVVKKSATNVWCEKCPSGQTATYDQKSCRLACGHGTYLVETLQGEVCRPCVRGTVSNLDGTACIPCKGGTFPNGDRSACVTVRTPQGPPRVIATPPKPTTPEGGPNILETTPGLGTTGPAGAGAPLGGARPGSAGAR